MSTKICEDGYSYKFQLQALLTYTRNNQIIVALLYYKNPRSDKRPLATDYFLITASTNQPKGPVLAAARIPVGKVALPLRFTLTEANGLDRDEFRSVLQGKDVWLQVQVCAPPSNDNDTADRLACPSFLQSTTMKAQGVAKFIQLQDQSSFIRAPASLALE